MENTLKCSSKHVSFNSLLQGKMGLAQPVMQEAGAKENGNKPFD